MSRTSSVLCLGALVVSCALASPAAAREPRRTFAERLQLAGRVAPLGLALESETTVRWRFGPDGDFLLEDDHLDVGVYAGVTPVMSLVGGVIELQPAAFFVLRARALRLDWFGTFGCLSTFEGLDADWSPAVLAAQEDADAGQVSSGVWLDLDAQLRAMVGSFVVAADVHPMWIHAAIGAPYYEPYNDLLQAADDLVLDVNAIAGWRFTDALFVGLRWQLLVSDAAGQPRHTLAGLVHWETPLGRGPVLQLDGLLGAYLVDPYRAGDPWAAVAATLAWRL